MLYTCIYIPMSSATPQTLLWSILGAPITASFPDGVKSTLFSVQRLHSILFGLKLMGNMDLAARANPAHGSIFHHQGSQDISDWREQTDTKCHHCQPTARILRRTPDHNIPDECPLNRLYSRVGLCKLDCASSYSRTGDRQKTDRESRRLAYPKR